MPEGAPKAHLTEEVVSLRVNPKRFRSIIWMCFSLGLPFAAAGAIIVGWGQEGRGFGVAVFLLGALFLFFGVMNFGIARARPVALRLDEDGASGYYVPSVTWDEVEKVGVERPNDDDGGRLVFKLKDVQALRNRQKTAWARFGTMATGKEGWHLGVPQLVLDVPVDDLAATAQRFLDGSR